MLCAVFSFASLFPTCAQTYTSKSALLASMWLGLKPSWPIVTLTMCLLKDDMGTDDVTDMQLLICANYPYTLYPIYSFTMIYLNQRARLLRTILKTFLFPCMTGCMTYLSDGCIGCLLQDKNRKFSARCDMFEALPMGKSWHDAHVLDAWDYLWKHHMAKVAGL